MPQLMPLMWVFSSFMLLFLLLLMSLLYSVKNCEVGVTQMMKANYYTWLW